MVYCIVAKIVSQFYNSFVPRGDIYRLVSKLKATVEAADTQLLKTVAHTPIWGQEFWLLGRQETFYIHSNVFLSYSNMPCSCRLLKGTSQSFSVSVSMCGLTAPSYLHSCVHARTSTHTLSRTHTDTVKGIFEFVTHTGSCRLVCFVHCRYPRQTPVHPAL